MSQGVVAGLSQCGRPAIQRAVSSSSVNKRLVWRHASSNAKPGTASPPRRVIFSGIQPTGIPHLGNYLGALKNWVKLQNDLLPSGSASQSHDMQAKLSPQPGSSSIDQLPPELYFCVVGLHAITLPQNPARLRQDSRDMLATLLAIGLDPHRCTIFRQEQVPEHAELAWILNCHTSYGRLQRMTTWKSRLATARNANSEAEVDESMLQLGLFAYPVLQAADVLLYDTSEVPVGEDQTQHIELTRDLAASFNQQYRTNVFRVPRHVLTPQARILNIRDPSSKMSKSNPDARTRILLTDTIEQARDKLRGAVTDSEKAITYNPIGRPGVSNLLSMLAGLTDQSPDDLVTLFANKSMKDLKDAVGDALAPLLNSFQAEHARLSRDPGYLDSIEAIGRRKASKAASSKMQAVRQCIGLDY